MYAVIKTGGKQYKVAKGDKLRVEKLDLPVGENLELGQVLLVGEGDQIKIGAPFLADAKVAATVVEQGRGDKIEIVKFRRRKHHRKQMGHRQAYTELEITGITA